MIRSLLRFSFLSRLLIVSRLVSLSPLRVFTVVSTEWKNLGVHLVWPSLT